MSTSDFTRVNYFDHQFLQPADFTDEQSYHLAMHRRHNISAHIWGIVLGLEITKDSVGNLAVSSGLAVDGYGRELILPHPHSLDTHAFDNKGSNNLQVWLKYAQVKSNPSSAGYSACGTAPGDPRRTQEYVVLDLIPPEPNLVADVTVNLPEQRMPSGVLQADLLFDGTSIPPDDPTSSWPIYLGQIIRQPGQPPTYDVDMSGRPYAGLVGELIRAPSGRGWVQIGAEEKNDLYRFAVYLPEIKDNKAGGTTLNDCSTDPFPNGIDPRLGIDSDGNLNVRGDTYIEGDLTVDGGAIEFGAGPAVGYKRPWQVYHVDVAEKEGDGASPRLNQLRIEMAADQNPKGRNQVVVGTWSDKEKKFKPCLTIDDMCTVTVHGNLSIEGNLVQLPVGLPLSAAFIKNLLTENPGLIEPFMEAVLGDSVLVKSLFKDLVNKPALDDAFLNELIAQPSLLDAMFNKLVANPASAARFFNRLVTHQDLLKAIAHGLKADQTLSDSALAGLFTNTDLNAFLLGDFLRNDNPLKTFILAMCEDPTLKSRINGWST